MTFSELDISPSKEKQFIAKGIDAPEKLLRFFPTKYIDCTKETDIVPGEFCVFIAKPLNISKNTNKTPMIKMNCYAPVHRIYVNVVWFRKEYLYSSLSFMVGLPVLVAGLVNYSEEYHNYTITNPFLFTPDINDGKKIYPVYSKISGMSADYLEAKIKEIVEKKTGLHNIWPQWVLDSHNIIDTDSAINKIHFPFTTRDIDEALNRFVFDDLMYFATNIQKMRQNSSAGSPFNAISYGAAQRVVASLPYELTEDQRKILNSIVKESRSGKRINALVQGDVGSGKSIIAHLSMMIMAESGYQAVLMAPTQVLARQHYDELCKLVEPYGFKVAFFGGSKIRKTEKEALYKGISSGDIHFVVGTHSLLNPALIFKDLALIVVDEEHKFGVLQREALLERASRGVHFITMSATPIPRSLAKTIYGDGISLYTIKTLPKGRMPVKTFVSNDQQKVFEFIKEQMIEGKQIYVVCPMIEKSEEMEGVLSIEELYQIYYNELFPFGAVISTITGKTSKEEMAETVKLFKNGRIDLILATTVIEVGFNVPNASVIVIHNAERFGLAGLHQLRGRVGRGSCQSYCVLMSEEADNPRLNIMCKTTDGFVIAEEDMKLRGAGELIGLKQSGDDKYLTLALRNPELFEDALRLAEKMIQRGEHKAALEVYETQYLANTPTKKK